MSRNLLHARQSLTKLNCGYVSSLPASSVSSSGILSSRVSHRVVDDEECSRRLVIKQDGNFLFTQFVHFILKFHV